MSAARAYYYHADLDNSVRRLHQEYVKRYVGKDIQFVVMNLGIIAKAINEQKIYYVWTF